MMSRGVNKRQGVLEKFPCCEIVCDVLNIEMYSNNYNT